MKKFMTSIKTLAALLIAGAAMTACSSSDDNIANEQPVNPATQKYIMTVNASKGDGATTRALTLDGSTLNASWATTENVYVKKGTNWVTGSLQPQTAGATANLTGVLSGTVIAAGDALTLQFPKKSAITFEGQTGTIADIEANYDYATANVTVASVANGQISVDGTTTFQNHQAIIKFTLLDKADGTTELNPSAFTITDGTNTVELTSIPEATYTANGDGVLYVAFPASGSAKTITLTATVGSDTYTYTTSGTKTFALGQYYEITVKMTKQAPANTGHALSSAVVGEVVGSDGLAYAGASYNNLPTGVTAVAKVCYVDGSGHGLALALTDEGAMDWDSAVSACATHTPAIAGGKWKLATQAEWNNMINANGVAGLRDGFTSVGGSNLIQGHQVYLSSTDVANSSGRAAWAYDFNMGGWTTGNKTSDGANARACLAF